ncbi:MAG TPA: tagaturonate epimerase family protein, partial [Anaerolinea sp.]|nr:tagaturonate epimerase family protein [Anaerolinea sp.]
PRHGGGDGWGFPPGAPRHARGRVHLKTAGTSYLEALRVAAEVSPDFFRRVFTLSLERYPTDRATYHVSARPERIPALDGLFDVALPDLLDLFDARQVLHVAFGAVLAQYGGELKALLDAHEEAYYAGLHAHFERHLRPFAAASDPGAPSTPYRPLRIGPNLQKDTHE